MRTSKLLRTEASHCDTNLLATKQDNSRILLNDLHGMDEARRWGEMMARDIADYKQGKLQSCDFDRGALVCGPPGCGKTTFAKALAATCNVPLIAASYTKWQSRKSGHLGNVLKAMRKDFERAKQLAPCIFFIDEIDAFPSRDEVEPRSREWWVSIMNALLEWLDGASSRDGVIVVAATNRPDTIDPALVRPGRLDHIIEIGLPSNTAIEGILRHHLRGELANEGLNAVAIAASGLTGADIASIVKCARRTARQQERGVTLQDLFAELDKDGSDRSPEMLWRAAVHEAGHAAVAILLDLATEVSMNLIQRRRSGGYTAIAARPACVTRDMAERNITCMLAGRAAEEIIVGDVSAGCGGSTESDLAQATELAIKMVASFGLCERDDLIYLDSAKRNRLLVKLPEVREKAQNILRHGYKRARKLIQANKTQIRAIARALLERRGLSDSDIRALLVRASTGNPSKPRVNKRRSDPRSDRSRR